MIKSLVRVVLPLTLISLFGSNASGDGIAGTGLRFKSIVIDGLHYETENAVVRSNGIQTVIDELQVGHRIYAVVDMEAMTASEIDQFDAVVGKIDSVVTVDPTLNQYELEILGQVVRTRIETVMHVDDKFKFESGKHVRINGIRLEDNTILATSVEKADKKDEPILMGIVDVVDGEAFEIAGLRVQTPYHLEHVQEGWMVPGAAVQVIGGEYRHGVFEADSIARVPADLVTLQGMDVSSAQSWIEGDIEWVDAEARAMKVNGFEVEVSHRVIMLDKRDEIRTFDFDLLYASDDVEVVVARRTDDRLVAVKVVRVKKSKRRLRAPVESWDELAMSAKLLGSDIRIDNVGDLKFRGKKLKLEDLREHIGADDGLLLEWNGKGQLKKLTIVSESERWSEFHGGGKKK